LSLDINHVDRVFHEGLPLVDQVLRWMSRRLGSSVSFDEMRSYAHAALLDAARTFDPSRASLSTYVARKVRWAILDNLKRERKCRRAAARATALLASERLALEPLDDTAFTDDEHDAQLDGLLEMHAAALAMGLVGHAAMHEDGYDTPEDRTARAELSHRMRGALANLPEREKALIERHYFEGEDFDEIAADLGISKSWASRLHTQALASLAGAISGRYWRARRPEP